MYCIYSYLLFNNIVSFVVFFNIDTLTLKKSIPDKTNTPDKIQIINFGGILFARNGISLDIPHILPIINIYRWIFSPWILLDVKNSAP